MSRKQLILCGGTSAPKQAAKDAIELDTSPNAPAHKRVFLRLDRLTERLLDNLDPVLADAVEIASYVFMADRLVKRGTEQMGRMGVDWRRDLCFKIPVRKADIWTQKEIYGALVEALSFLSEDEFAFEFEPGDPAIRLDPFLGFNDPNARTIKPDDIILFSGGLDSLAGAVQRVIGDNRNAVFVTHKNSKNMSNRQDALVDALGTPPGSGQNQIFYAPVWVTKGDYEPTEYTQRTRSFLFVTLGVAIGRMFDCDDIQLFENGITSFNLPIAEHVIGTRASRTTHPRALASFANFFSLLTQRQIKIENHFLWKTKAEVVEVLRIHGCENLIPSSTSCANVRNWAMTTKQCGVCSQCIERRIAVLGAGLAECEPEDSYNVELFTGAHTNAEDITMAEQHISRAARFAAMTKDSFLMNYGQVFRTLPYLPGRADDNAGRIFELHRRYGHQVIEVVDARLRTHAGFVNAQELASTSLLAMINSPLGAAPVLRDPAELEAPASQQAALDNKPIRERRFTLAVDGAAKCVVFVDGPELRGKAFELVKRLAEQFQEDRTERKKPEQHTFVATRTLMQDLKIKEHSLSQRVLRIRTSLKEQFVRSTDYMIDEQDIIQSDRWKGYRLNPYLILVDPADLQRT